MKALILAAGYGKRLRPITETIPKAMVEVNGTPLLVNALNILKTCGISEIGIVVGHMSEYIKGTIGNNWHGIPIKYYDNPRYLETNNIVSLHAAQEFCDDDMLMLECDLFYRDEMIQKLMEGHGECSILVSPFNPKTMDGTVVEVDAEGRVHSLTLGAWQGENFNYSHQRKTVNIYRFKKEFIQNKYMPLIDWYVKNMGENSYYERVLGSLLYLRECDVRAVEVDETMWCEIDDIDDLNRAKKQFSEPLITL